MPPEKSERPTRQKQANCHCQRNNTKWRHKTEMQKKKQEGKKRGCLVGGRYRKINFHSPGCRCLEKRCEKERKTALEGGETNKTSKPLEFHRSPALSVSNGAERNFGFLLFHQDSRKVFLRGPYTVFTLSSDTQREAVFFLFLFGTFLFLCPSSGPLGPPVFPSPSQGGNSE